MTEQNIEINLGLVKGNINLEIARIMGVNYQKVLQECEDIRFSKETINQDYEPLKKLKGLEAKIKELENPHYQAWKTWNDARKSILDPISLVLRTKTNEFSQLAESIRKEKEESDREIERVNDIKIKMDNTLMDFAQKIAGAESNEKLLEIERLLNLETAFTTKYQEFLPSFKLRCESIRGLLRVRKESIKELTTLNENELNSLENNNTEALEDILDRKAIALEKLEENGIKIQEEATGQAIAAISAIATPILETVKPRRTTWKWDIENIQLMAKKHPDWVVVIPNVEALKNYLQERKEDKTIKEETIDGLRIYQDKLY